MFTMKGMLVFISFTGRILQGEKIVGWGKKKTCAFPKHQYFMDFMKAISAEWYVSFPNGRMKKSYEKKIPTYVYIIILYLISAALKHKWDNKYFYYIVYYIPNYLTKIYRYYVLSLCYKCISIKRFY